MRLIAASALLVASSCVTLHLPQVAKPPEVKAGPLVGLDDPLDAHPSTRVALYMFGWISVDYKIDTGDLVEHVRSLMQQELASHGFRTIATSESKSSNVPRSVSVRITKAEMWDSGLLFIMSHVQNPVADATLGVVVRDQSTHELFSRTYIGTSAAQGTHQALTLNQSIVSGVGATPGSITPGPWYEHQVSWALDEAVWRAVNDPAFDAAINTSP